LLVDFLFAGFRVFRLHFFPERRGLREATVVSSTPTSRYAECRYACPVWLSYECRHVDMQVKLTHFSVLTFDYQSFIMTYPIKEKT
jgi:hypothetical protein